MGPRESRQIPETEAGSAHVEATCAIANDFAPSFADGGRNGGSLCSVLGLTTEKAATGKGSD